MPTPIEKIIAESIEDSRGNPTIKVSVFAGGVSESFSVPSGASTGIHEAHELRDADGKGMSAAINAINNIITPNLIGKNVEDQKIIDELMIALDETPNKDKLGGNTMIGVSIAVAKTAAKATGKQTYEYLRTLANISPSKKVPFLYMNLLNGGKHAKNGLAFQEYHVVPETDDVKASVAAGIAIQNSLEKIIARDFDSASLVLGDEGGFAPMTHDIRKPLEMLAEAVKENNFGFKIRFALDVASSSFFDKGMYNVADKNISPTELMQIYDSLIKEFDLISIEDPFDEESFSDFSSLKENHQNLIVVGDDITVTNKIRLSEAIEKKSVGGMIIKPNQIGTLSETLETMSLARQNNIELIVSHRSGETMDDFIADLAYAFGCFGLKTGSPRKPERMSKYKRLEEIINK